MAKDEGIVKYQARDGQEISLGFETVRAYLVHGDKEKVTPQELMFFMGVCKSRGLNPFKKDCYLIKYGSDAAAIVTSIDFFRSRARAQKDCKGWKAGIVIQKKEGLEFREGALVVDGEKLVGGWFEAKPDGWPEPKKHSVTLKGYIKHTKEGKITRFWSEENQPSQIMKVAESQGLRIVWPDEFQMLYTEEEILAEPGDPGEVMRIAADKAKTDAIEKFKSSIPAPFIFEHPNLQEFLSKLAQANRCEIDDVMVEAAEKLEEFWKGYEEYRKENAQPAGAAPSGQESQPSPPANPTQDPGLPPPFENHAAADTEIQKKDEEKRKKGGQKKPHNGYVVCPKPGRLQDQEVSLKFCKNTCPVSPCQVAGKERQPGENG